MLNCIIYLYKYLLDTICQKKKREDIIIVKSLLYSKKCKKNNFSLLLSTSCIMRLLFSSNYCYILYTYYIILSNNTRNVYIYKRHVHKEKVKLTMSNQKYKRKECKKNGNDPKM